MTHVSPTDGPTIQITQHGSSLARLGKTRDPKPCDSPEIEGTKPHVSIALDGASMSPAFYKMCSAMGHQGGELWCQPQNPIAMLARSVLA